MRSWSVMVAGDPPKSGEAKKTYRQFSVSAPTASEAYQEAMARLHPNERIIGLTSFDRFINLYGFHQPDMHPTIPNAGGPTFFSMKTDLTESVERLKARHWWGGNN